MGGMNMTRLILSLLSVILICGLVEASAEAQTTPPPGTHDTGVGGVIRVTPEGVQEINTIGQEEAQPAEDIAEPVQPEAPVTTLPPNDVAPVTEPATPAEIGRPEEVAPDEAPPLVSPPPPVEVPVVIEPEPAPLPPRPAVSPFVDDDFAVLPPAGANLGFWAVIGAAMIGAGTAFRKKR